MVGTSFKDWCRYFQYNKEEAKENRAEARDALLVVATLIAAVTFQAGVNPPGGVWQDSKEGYKPGTAIFAQDANAYFVFLTANTLAFSAAVLVIMSLTHKFPFKFEVYVATISMSITYGSSIFAVTPNVAHFRFVLIVAATPLVTRCLFQLFIEWRKNYYPGSSCLIPPFGKGRNETTQDSPQETRARKNELSSME